MILQALPSGFILKGLRCLALWLDVDKTFPDVVIHLLNKIYPLSEYLNNKGGGLKGKGGEWELYSYA